MPKITFMGAGSTVFARNVLGDCMCSPVLTDSEIALYDIDGDGGKELLLGGPWSDGVVGLLYVFTIQNDVPVGQPQFRVDPHSLDRPLVFKNGTIQSGYDNRGPLYY